jgi:hypothetical protein
LAGFAGVFSGGIFRFGKWFGESLEAKRAFGFQVLGFRFYAAEIGWLIAKVDGFESETEFPSGTI